VLAAGQQQDEKFVGGQNRLAGDGSVDFETGRFSIEQWKRAR
jgi:hypothetical protein